MRAFIFSAELRAARRAAEEDKAASLQAALDAAEKGRDAAQEALRAQARTASSVLDHLAREQAAAEERVAAAQAALFVALRRLQRCARDDDDEPTRVHARAVRRATSVSGRLPTLTSVVQVEW